MKLLRIIRILTATLFFAASIAFLALGLNQHPLAIAAERAQIIPSMIAVSMGATLFWFIVTIVFGRVYCSTVCPIGTLQELLIPLRRFLPRTPTTFRYKPAKQIRMHFLIIYLICLAIGFVAVPLIIEPWNILSNICATFTPDMEHKQWLTLGIGASTGIIGGIISLLLIIISSLYFGRDFCNVVCPLGTMMALIESRNLYHIEINPDKCSGCLKCEDTCSASCIKVTSRFVDNSRCIRCLDCINVCPDDAIKFQRGKNTPASPLFRRVKRAGK